MGILDGIVEWIAEQVMNGLDLISCAVTIGINQQCLFAGFNTFLNCGYCITGHGDILCFKGVRIIETVTDILHQNIHASVANTHDTDRVALKQIAFIVIRNYSQLNKWFQLAVRSA